MPELTRQPPAPPAVADRVARIEARLARIEAQLGLDAAAERAAVTGENGFALGAPPSAAELERRVEQSGFPIAGVIALAVGAGFMLVQPYPGLPAWAPSVAGTVVAAALVAAAHAAQRRFGMLAGCVRGAAMVLLQLAALRLFFFGATPALGLESFAGRTLLLLPVAVSGAIAWRRQSAGLVALTLLLGCASVIAINSGLVVAIGLPLLAAGVVAAAVRRGWAALLLVGVPLVYATYFAWACGNPILGGRYHYAAAPAAAPVTLLAVALLFAAGALFRAQRDHEEPATIVTALLNCFLGYGAFLVHTAAAFPRSFAGLHAVASAVYLGIAVSFWARERSRVSTFVYAITGYVALSMTILKASAVPDVFVWLSLQSVVVVATAVWFRSRLIVVANFLIYVAIVLGYMVVAKSETGISLGFGVVALLSARILNWKKDRLELKTEVMRNAYLLAAFVVFPYALHHLVPLRHVGLAWVALAVAYYLLNFVLRSEKYRWMGHATLALTTLFLVFAGHGQLAPAYRVAAFLALGTVLLLVSLPFARVRR